MPHALPRPDRPSHSGSQVSQNAILAVVSQNHRSLGLCYERVLKHDNTLKHARVVTRVKIGLSGRVTAVNVEDAFKSTEIGQCLVQTIRQLALPAFGRRVRDRAAAHPAGELARSSIGAAMRVSTLAASASASASTSRRDSAAFTASRRARVSGCAGTNSEQQSSNGRIEVS